ncbi:MAG TPA: hypothetical protein VMF69_22585 [Gemmataceae bacterium]|nr:hypothetical protein [Gemmataceae bacterium]
MSGLRRLVLVAVVVACGMSTIFSVDRNSRPIARIELPQQPMEFAESLHESIVPAEPLDDVRKAERSRRAVRPAGDPERKNGLNYEGVLKGGNGRGTRPHPKPAEPMPPTSCRSIERAPKYENGTGPFEVHDHKLSLSGPFGLHDLTVSLFETNSGFGFGRMMISTNDRGVEVASPVIDRVQLVSLLTGYQPSVYVLDEMATPPLARQAKRRPLDEFERLGLDAVRRGEELMWTREAPTRMFGAIRARADCLDCHTNANEGDLLGAFTYYLKAPVDRLRGMR